VQIHISWNYYNITLTVNSYIDRYIADTYFHYSHNILAEVLLKCENDKYTYQYFELFLCQSFNFMEVQVGDGFLISWVLLRPEADPSDPDITIEYLTVRLRRKGRGFLGNKCTGRNNLESVYFK
jgi:hypothetical protein